MSSGPKGFSLHSSLFRCGYLPSANPVSNIQRSEARKSLSGREALIFVTYSSAQFILVPGGGVEPPRGCPRRILSPSDGLLQQAAGYRTDSHNIQRMKGLRAS